MQVENKQKIERICKEFAEVTKGWYKSYDNEGDDDGCFVCSWDNRWEESEDGVEITLLWNPLEAGGGLSMLGKKDGLCLVENDKSGTVIDVDSLTVDWMLEFYKNGK